jgi:hypothetical protein
MLPPEPDNHAIPCINLHWTTRLPVGQHRVDRIGRGSALGCQDKISYILFEMSPFGPCHRGALANDLQGNVTEGLSTHNSGRLQQ